VAAIQDRSRPRKSARSRLTCTPPYGGPRVGQGFRDIAVRSRGGDSECLDIHNCFDPDGGEDAVHASCRPRLVVHSAYEA
jgi:hypothetical protein